MTKRKGKVEMPKEIEGSETKSEVKTIDPTVAQDIDGDGVLDLDPFKAQMTITDLVILDHELRDHGSSVADLLRNVAHTARGIRV